MTSAVSLPYHEPSITTILIQSSFLVALNVLNWAVDRLAYCGLVAQILVGIAWGSPGGSLLSVDDQKAIVNFGYVGLILLVYEGGLETSVSSLRANWLLSVAVAVTGVATPIALSFVLAPLAGASFLQCFAAGAALSSTSLGTSFTVLRACGLVSSRIGIVLTSAAMLDDVVGLVMVQVISNMGEGRTVTAAAIVRPVLVSVAFSTLVVLACWFLGRRLHEYLHRPGAWATRLASHPRAPFAASTLLLFGAVAASSYAGTSNLFAAYLAGATVSWWTSLHGSGIEAGSDDEQPSSFSVYYRPALSRILQPFFFASIGFSVPIRLMFSSAVVWKGVVYTLLMMAAKMACGLWVVDSFFERNFTTRLRPTKPARPRQGDTVTDTAMTDVQSDSNQREAAPRSPRANPPVPLRQSSLYPSAVLGLAMVPRGEIGFLIVSTAQSNGIFNVHGSATANTTSVFLIASWAIVLCTVVGPLAVGIIMNRVRKLSLPTSNTESRDVLGVWGSKHDFVP